MSETNKQLVRRFYEEVECQGKLELVEELFSPEFRDAHNSVSPFAVRGIDGVKKLAGALHDVFDLKVAIEQLVAEGDRVVAQIACQMTQKHPFMGAAATGRTFSVKGVEIFRVEAGKLVERWVFIDVLPMMRELGVIPK